MADEKNISKVEVSGQKTWVDNNNENKKRPTSITINLLANGNTTGKSKTVTADDGWAWKFTDLPKYDDNGNEIIYTIKEADVDGYVPTYDDKQQNVTNTYKPEKVEVRISKRWDDADNQDGKRPNSITVELLANGITTGKTLILNKDDKWTGSFTDLDKKANGKEIKYIIKEVEVTGYESKIIEKEKNVYEITNSHTPEKTSVSGTKTWDDNNNQDGKRPTEITINLLADGNKIASKTVKEDKDGNWKWTFENLDKYKGGKEIKYTVAEEKVDGYTTAVAENGRDVTNTHRPEKTSVSGTKTWDDNRNQDGKRPDHIILHLFANGTELTDKVKVVTAENDWEWSFTDLPKYANGTELTYTVTEEAVTGYTTDITGNAATGFTITNTHTPELISIEGKKNWNDAGNQDGKRPASITINLLADGVEVDSRTVTAEDDWRWSFTELPKKAAGEDIVYTITEDAADGYLSEVKGYDVTNTITKVLVSKVDITDQKELEGAHIQIIDENGNVVEEWDSKKEPHAVTGLKTGVTYILRETVAPDGYELTTDTTFVLKEDGTVDTTKTTTTMKDGVLLVEDMPKPTPNTTVAVTKRLVTAAGDVITAIDQTFYVALYADSDCTKRISDVKALVFKNASSATVTFDNVTAGVTYYVGECDKDGTSYLADVTADGTVYTVEFGNGNVVKVENAGGSSAVYFDNSFMKTPDGYYKEGKLTITKKLRDAEGNAINSEETFYAGIFADAAYTTLSDAVSENIIPLNLNGGSEASVQMVVPVLEGQTVMLYVTEVDAEGNPVEGTKGFAYGVEVEHGEVILSEAQMSADVTITNIKDVEKESESEETSESESTSKKTTTSKTAAKTGDDTPVGPLTGLLFASAAIIGAYMRRRRKAAK